MGKRKEDPISERVKRSKCIGKSGRVVQGARFRYESLRRRGFEPHLLHFSQGNKGSKGERRRNRDGDKKEQKRNGQGIEDNVAEWSKACDSKSLLLWRRRFKSCHCRFSRKERKQGKEGGRIVQGKET